MPWERFDNNDQPNETQNRSQGFNPNTSDWQGLTTAQGEYWNNANQNLIANNVLPATEIAGADSPSSGAAPQPGAAGGAGEGGWTPNQGTSFNRDSSGEGGWMHGGDHGGHQYRHQWGGDSTSSTGASGAGDPLVNQLLSDPVLLQSLQSLSGQMSPQGFAEVAQSLTQQLMTNPQSSDSTLLTQALQQVQSGLSSSDVTALENAISTLPTSADTTPTSTGYPTTPTDTTPTSTGYPTTPTDTTPTSTGYPTTPTDTTPTSTGYPTTPTDTTPTSTGDTTTPTDTTPTTTITPTDASGTASLPAGYSASQLAFSDSFNNLSNWNMGVTDVMGEGTGVTWQSAGSTGTDVASNVSTGPNGLAMTADASASTSSSITSKQTFGGNGQPYYVQFQMQGGGDWPALWMLPQGGGDGATEIDMQEGNYTAGGANEEIAHSHLADGTAPDATVNSSNNLDTTMNTYGAYVQNNQVTIYLNGQEVGVMPTDGNTLSEPMHLIISNALSDSSDDSWHEPAVSGATQMLVSGVQVYDGPPSS